jgi:hypothetical protein
MLIPMPDITITVTADHIARGKPSKECACPIALAMSEQIDGCEFVRVGLAVAEWVDRDRLTHVAYMPESVNVFIIRFDGRMPVDPFSFVAQSIMRV